MYKVLTPYEEIKNIQSLLDKYKKSSEFSLFLPGVSSDPQAFTCESQLPDMVLKTRTPIDRNRIFFNEKKRKSANKVKAVKKRQESNYFPV